MIRRSLLPAFALVAALLPLGAGHADPPTHETGYIPVAAGTLDETTLHYKVMLPDPAQWGPGPYPAVVDYSGYIPALTVYDGLDDRFVAAGYAVVGLNIRGSACSGGKFDYFEPRQSIDGIEALDYLATRPWSNGRFGMVGKSYPGITQLFVAGARAIPGDGTRDQNWVDRTLADHLHAIVPGHVFADLYRDVPYPGGILNATFAGGWSAQRVNEGFVVGPQHYARGAADQKCLENQAGHAANPPFNPFVRALQPQNNFDNEMFHERSPWWWAHEIATPTLLVQTWQDEQVGSRATHLLDRLPDGTPWQFLGTNGDHGEYYGPDVFPHILRFLTYHLRKQIPEGEQRTITETRTVTEPVLLPNGKPHPTKTTTRQETTTRPETYAEALDRFVAEDRVRVNWETGAGRRSRWSTTYADWPVPGTAAERWYATADGRLAPQPQDPAGAGVGYDYVPGEGSQERGGYDLAGEEPASWNRRPPAGTAASFTTPPLDGDRVVLGSAAVDLHLSSTAPDTDLEVTLSEVRPDGVEVFVQQGWLRASHRAEDPRYTTPTRPFQTHLATDVRPLVPGTPTRMRVEIFPFGHVFREGSRIRVTVAAPHVHPDLWGFAAVPLPARNTIHTGGVTTTTVTLPLAPGAPVPVRTLPACGGVGVLRNQPCRPAA